MAQVKAEKENSPPKIKAESDEESDPYYISSDSDSEDGKPPPMIDIGERSTKGLSELKATLTSKPAEELDEEEKKAKSEELAALKDGRAKEIKKQMEEGKKEELPDDKKTQVPTNLIQNEVLAGFKDKFEHLEDTLKKQNAEKVKSQKTEVQLSTGKEELGKMKDRFEKGLEDDSSIQKLSSPDMAAYSVSPYIQRQYLYRSDIDGGPKGDLELEALQSGAVAKTAKSAWETQAKADKAGSTQPRGPIDIGLPTGGVKERMSKIVAGGEELEESDDENETDPNIVKSSKKKKTKEELNVQVGNLKSKWEEGKVETAETTDADPDRAAELQSLKGASVKERFKERTANDKDETQRASKLPEDLVNFSSEAREKFLKGEAFVDQHPVEKTAVDDFSEFKKLGDVKGAFEGKKKVVEGDEMTEEERAARKKEEIQGEFARYKKIRAKQVAKEEEEMGDGGEEGRKDLLTAEEKLAFAERGNILKRFEDGTAFAGDERKEKKTEMKMAVAKKARSKFKEMDASAEPVLPGQKTHGKSASRRDKESDPNSEKPEAINRRMMSVSDSEEEEEYEMSSIMNKFKEMAAGKAESQLPRPSRPISPSLDGIKSEADARNLAARFEARATGTDGEAGESSEQRRARLKAEFDAYKAEAEQLKAQGAQPDEMPEALKDLAMEEDLALAAAHASKMKTKWEKMEKKEAKKAQKANANVKPKESKK